MLPTADPLKFLLRLQTVTDNGPVIAIEVLLGQSIVNRKEQVMTSQNSVAKMLKIAGIVLAIVGVLTGAVAGSSISETIGDGGFTVFLMSTIGGVFSGGMLYAFGEVIELLHQIKNNTGDQTQQDNMELPKL